MTAQDNAIRESGVDLNAIAAGGGNSSQNGNNTDEKDGNAGPGGGAATGADANPGTGAGWGGPQPKRRHCRNGSIATGDPAAAAKSEQALTQASPTSLVQLKIRVHHPRCRI